MTMKWTSSFAVGLLLTSAITVGRVRAIAPVRAQDAVDPGPGVATTIDVPGATNTFPFGINASGVIVGRYLGAGGLTHGFVRTADDEVCTDNYPTASFVVAGITNVCVIDVPGANFTVASDLNAQGDIVGWYTRPGSPVRHGFLLKAGTSEFESFDPPGSIFTNAVGINEQGDISGRYCTSSCTQAGSGSIWHGFLVPNGDFANIQTFDVPNAIATIGFKLNARGDIVGGFEAADLTEQLFVLSHDEFTAFVPPGGQPVALDQGGISEQGEIVGTYCDAAIPCGIQLTGTHGFLLRSGEFTTIDITGISGVTVKATSAAGINPHGDIVGSYSDGAHFHGFMLSRLAHQHSRQ